MVENHLNLDKCKQYVDALYKLEPNIILVPDPAVQWKLERHKYKYNPSQPFNPKNRLMSIPSILIVLEYDNAELKTLTREEGLRLIEASSKQLEIDGWAHEIFDHGGKSPHIHIIIPELITLKDNPLLLRAFKRVFVETYARPSDNGKIDLSLTGVHLLQLPYQSHFKPEHQGRVKNLIKEVYPQRVNKLNQILLRQARVLLLSKNREVESQNLEFMCAANDKSIKLLESTCPCINRLISQNHLCHNDRLFLAWNYLHKSLQPVGEHRLLQIFSRHSNFRKDVTVFFVNQLKEKGHHFGVGCTWALKNNVCKRKEFDGCRRVGV